MTGPKGRGVAQSLSGFEAIAQPLSAHKGR
jgi:hypothetical protein